MNKYRNLLRFPNLYALVFLVFLILKLGKVVHWSWLIILSPLLIWLGLFLLYLCLEILLWIVKILLDM